MAFYRMSGSSKGELHGASILVTVDGGTSGETVTLTKDTFSKSGVLSDDGTCLFTDLLEAGTYTATYQTHSNTVSVSASDILNKVTKNLTISTSKTVTLTLEGAKEDTITIKNSSGVTVGTCIFPSGSTTGTVSFELPESGSGSYTFTSSVAKDITTGTSNYSKTETITESTTNVKVMPEGDVVYWYGYVNTLLFGELKTNEDWTYQTYSKGTQSINTNSITLDVPTTYVVSLVYFDKMVNLSKYKTIHLIRNHNNITARGYNEKKVYVNDPDGINFNGYRIGADPWLEGNIVNDNVVNTQTQYIVLFANARDPEKQAFALWFDLK